MTRDEPLEDPEQLSLRKDTPEAIPEPIAPPEPPQKAARATVRGPQIVAGLWGPVSKFDCSVCAFSTVDPDPAVHAGHLSIHEAPHDQPGGLNG